MSKWIEVPEGVISINEDQEVLGYNEGWIRGGLCPDGIRVCKTNPKARNGWQSARPCKCNEAWINDLKAFPTHYMIIEKFNLN